MKKNKFNFILFKLVLYIFLLYIFYLLYVFLFNSFRKINKFEDAPTTPMQPTTTYNVAKGEDSTLQSGKDAESSTSKKPMEDSGKCGTNVDVIDYCTNYNSCCGKPTDTNKCLCTLPFIKNCRSKFEACLNNNPNQLKPNDLMNSCIDANKTCCKEYSHTSIDSSIFNKAIKNEPNITPICSLTNIKNIAQKCMEICQTKPECKAYSVSVGKIAQDIGTCNIYDKVDIVPPEIDPSTGKSKNNVSADYYTRK